MDQQRFNAVRNGDGFNCPRCYRSRSVVLIQRAGALYQCGKDGVEGCCARFRLEATRGVEVDTLVHVVEAEVARQSPEEFAARRARFNT